MSRGGDEHVPINERRRRSGGQLSVETNAIDRSDDADTSNVYSYTRPRYLDDFIKEADIRSKRHVLDDINDGSIKRLNLPLADGGCVL
jgi:hypothetical protein